MRPILQQQFIHSAIENRLGGKQTLVNEAKKAITENDVVIVGMRQNPAVKTARKLLSDRNIEFKYLEYGSYFSMWRPRLSIKMWTGFVTFPQIFVGGMLVGGSSDLKKLIENDEFDELLKD